MPPTLSHVPRTVVIQRACTLAGLFVLVLQGSMGGHMLLVKHSRCPEHGELVHNSDAHPRTAQELPSPASREMRGCPNGDTAEAHDHCSVSASHRDGRVAIIEREARAHPCVESQGIAVRDAVVVARTPRFRVAPKNSPPA